MEGVRLVRLALPHLGRLHRLCRDHHRSKLSVEGLIELSKLFLTHLCLSHQFAWGPLCLLTTISILVGSSSRHVNQAIICTAHLYGVALYYATNWAEQRFAGVSYSRPEFLYYWVYYVGFNMPWAVVPRGEWHPLKRALSCCVLMEGSLAV